MKMVAEQVFCIYCRAKLSKNELEQYKEYHNQCYVEIESYSKNVMKIKPVYILQWNNENFSGEGELDVRWIG